LFCISDKVVIRGPKEDVNKAKEQLLQLAKDKEVFSYTADVKAKPEHHRFLIGRGGATINKVREAYPDVRIMFPRSTDEDQATIHLMGKRQDVEAVKEQFTKITTELANTVEGTLEVDPKWHRHFVVRGGAVIREIQDSCGGVIISFPRQNQQSATITLKGPKDCLEEAKKRITEIVDDLDATITQEVEIPQRFHRILLANRGARIQEISAEVGVQIKFPDRAPQQQQQGFEAGGPGENDTEEDPTRNIVLISGRKEKCDRAEELLKEMIPVTETVNVPFDFHRFLIGQRGELLQNLMRDHEVTVSIPPRDERRDDITVTGRRPNVETAIEAIKEKVEGFEAEQKDRELKSFQVTVEVNPDHHQRLIGPRGRTVNSFRDKYGVNVVIPRANSETPNLVTITGYETKANEAKDAILEMVREFESRFQQSITLDARIHSRIIGPRGRTIRKIMEDYSVEINFPRTTDPDPNLVTISGKEEDQVYDCIEYLRDIEEEFLQDVVVTPDYWRKQDTEEGKSGADNAYSQPQQQQQQQQTGLVIRGAPWDMAPPDTSNMEEFPSMGGGGSGASGLAQQVTATGSAWGPRRF
jgi:predicted RNA-binding protein YlqC (UPF0109 family)